LPDSANVFNDSPVEDPMAIEHAPPEPDLREPRRPSRDFTTLLWLGGWGGAAALALMILAITTQTENATERLRRIFSINEPAAIAQMPPRVAQLESDVQLLSGQVRALTADRERLLGRIALLESSIDDMTGAIKKQAATTAALAVKPALPSPPIATPTATASPPPANTANVAIPTPIATLAIRPDAPIPDAVPLPPPRVAAAQPAESEVSATNPIEFGLDLGGAATVDGIRQRWTTVKASFGPLLSGMYPLAARERRAGATGYRLVVGPLPNSLAATGLCAHFAAARTPCRAARYDGEQIAQH
jgi:hypothetical protein